MALAKVYKDTRASVVQLWHGVDEGRLSLEVERWIGLFRDKHPEAQVIKLSYEKGADEAELTNALHKAVRSGGLFTSSQLVVLTGLLAVEAKSELGVLIKELAKEPPTGAVVLLVEPGRVAWSKPLAKAMQKLGVDGAVTVREFAELSGPELERWIITRAKALGTKMSATVARQLAQVTAGDLRRVEQELNKLAAYRPEAEVALADIDLLVTPVPQDDVFAFIDCVARRDWPKAQVVLVRQFELGTSPQSLIGLLAWQLRVLASVRQTLDQGGGRTPGELAQQLNLKPFVVTKALQQIPYYSADKIAWLMGELAELDYQLKSSQVDPPVLFGVFLSKLNSLQVTK